MEKEKGEILHLFEKHVYGKSPEWDGKITSKVILENKDYLNGKATRQVVRLSLERAGRSLDLDLLVFYPNSVKKAPAFWDLIFMETIPFLPTIR